MTGRLAVAAATLTLVGCGGSDAPVQVLDERSASYDGMGVGATSAEIRDRFGPPLKSPDGGITPPDVEYYEVGGPTSFVAPPMLRTRAAGGGLRYRDTSWFVEGGRVYGFMTVADGARTRGGVAIGDDADVVEERYPEARCETANEGTEYVTFPLCEAELRPGHRVYFGGDPVRSIWLVVSADRAYRRVSG